MKMFLILFASILLVSCKSNYPRPPRYQSWITVDEQPYYGCVCRQDNANQIICVCPGEAKYRDFVCYTTEDNAKIQNYVAELIQKCDSWKEYYKYIP